MKYTQGKQIVLFALFFISIVGYLLFKLNSLGAQNEQTIVEGDLNTTCTRKQVYKLEPEFNRSLNDLLQPYSELGLEDSRNCINIQYTELEDDVHGRFRGDISSSNNLVIEINNNYTASNHELLNMIISHELIHARQFLMNLEGYNISCIDSEIEAWEDTFDYSWHHIQGICQNKSYLECQYSTALAFVDSYKELDIYKNESSDGYLNNLERMLVDNRQAFVDCKEFLLDDERLPTTEAEACVRSRVRSYISAMIKDSDFYTDQCSLEVQAN